MQASTEVLKGLIERGFCTCPTCRKTKRRIALYGIDYLQDKVKNRYETLMGLR